MCDMQLQVTLTRLHQSFFASSLLICHSHHWTYVTGPEFQARFPGARRRHVGSSLVFHIPLYRDFMLWGGLVDAPAPVARAVLRAGFTLLSLLGGIAEQTRTDPARHLVIVMTRPGTCLCIIVHTYACLFDTNFLHSHSPLFVFTSHTRTNYEPRHLPFITAARGANRARILLRRERADERFARWCHSARAA